MRGLVKRICKQMRNDRRSLAMIFVIPLVIITFLYFLLGENYVEINVAVLGSNDKIEEVIKDSDDCKLVKVKDDKKAKDILKDGDADAVIDIEDNMKIYMLESNAAYMGKVKGLLNDIQEDVMHQEPMETEYVYGDKLETQFEQLSYVLLGVICFFLVFLIAGISFVRERTMGTLERFMLTPIGKIKVVLGYTIGFGIFGMIQSVIILLFVHYVLGVAFEGSVLYAVIIMILLAFTAVSIGEFVSIFANNEFQVIQFIPIIIIPQIFYSGLLSLDGMPYHLDKLSYIMPIYFGCTGLKKVLINGQGFVEIVPYIGILLAFIVVFSILNILSLKKYRAA